MVWIVAIPVLLVLGEGSDVHADLFDANAFPRAAECGSCHPDQYREWSVSPHAYAVLSPVFNAMQETVNALTNGSNGDFCIRCHTPVGMQTGEPSAMAVDDRSPIAREGITCITCHRVNREFGKISGRFPVKSGDIYQPVSGPTGSAELNRAIESGEYRMTTEPGKPGRGVHRQIEPFFELSTPGMCGTCHDVSFVNGFRLEEAFSEYKMSPAAQRGVTCQDCHMVPDPSNVGVYAEGPAAKVNDIPTHPRKRTSHMFMGPDYSIVHPAVFPHNGRAQSMATIAEWLLFDWEAGWGTDAFEDEDHDDGEFPERWRSIDDRYDARELIDQNLELLEEARQARSAILKEGYRLGDIQVFKHSRSAGLRFEVEVRNGTDGHGVPTGFDAERLVFLRVEVTDESGRTIFSSGDLDPRGDLRDLHSYHVNSGHLPLDRQLFSLQSKFIAKMVRGGEREQVLAVNASPSPLPFVRPAATPNILSGRPQAVRKHRQGIEPLGHRTASYRVREANKPGRYHIKVALVSGMVPVNLVHEIAAVGFDYGLSADEVARRVVAGHSVLWERETMVEVP